MFVLTWAVVIVLSSGPRMMAIEEQRPYADRGACEQAIKDHETRMPDMVRGHYNLSWSVDIQVAGACAPKGDPA